MRNLILKSAAFLILAVTLVSFTYVLTGDNWYICTECCSTKKGSSAPWENGCKESSSGMHNYSFSGNAGNYNYTCRKCGASVELTSSQSPAASKCCATGNTHDWYHR